MRAEPGGHVVDNFRRIPEVRVLCMTARRVLAAESELETQARSFQEDRIHRLARLHH